MGSYLGGTPRAPLVSEEVTLYGSLGTFRCPNQQCAESGEPQEIDLSGQLAAMQKAGMTNVEMCLNGPKDPLRVRSRDFTYLLMPVQWSDGSTATDHAEQRAAKPACVPA